MRRCALQSKDGAAYRIGVMARKVGESGSCMWHSQPQTPERRPSVQPCTTGAQSLSLFGPAHRPEGAS